MPLKEHPGEIAGIITAAVGLLYALGKGIAWLIMSRDRRQKWIEVEVEKHVGRLESRVAEAERRATAAEERVDRIEREKLMLEIQVSRIATAFQLVTGELQRLDPRSTILVQAQQLFNRAFPPPRNLPTEHADLLDELHERTKP